MTTTSWTPAYVALGSNLDEPRSQVERAFTALEELRGSRLVVRSSLYHSRPLGPIAQPDFVNAVAGLLTTLGPADLLDELKATERRLGRAAPVERWGPRRIDLDLLVHGSARSDEPGLELPHPGLGERAFVLVPLAEIAPDLEVPGIGRVRTLADRVGRADLERIAA
jgi:2-amino-4-hydroxy-6-hydroxymethyldihydropteridine diphosphokinase